MLTALLACTPAPRARLGQTVSPDGRHVAVLFGAAVGLAEGGGVEVELWPTRGMRWPWAGRVFSAVGLPRAARRPEVPPGATLQPPVVLWRSATELEIRYSSAMRVTVQKPRVRRVHVTLRACPAPPPAPAGDDPGFRTWCT